MARRSQKVFWSTVFLVGTAALLWIHPASARRHGPGFPNVELTTQDGKKVHFYDDLIKGKMVVIDLIYTHCQYSCPLETARLVQVQKSLGDRVGKDIFFYSITIDPKRDTPEVLKAYMEKFHVGPGWTFLTGTKEDIDLLSRKIGLYSDPRETLDGHTPGLLVGNEPLGIWSRNSALDNPHFLSQMIGGLLDSYRGATQNDAPKVSTRIENFDPGQYLFVKKCSACHTVGQGDKIGPDLQNVANVRDRDWLVMKIKMPQEMLAEKDPITVALDKKYNHVKMPDLRIADEDINHLVGYLETVARKNPGGPATAAAKPADATAGAARQQR
jgi:protein SCO1/2